MPLPKDEADALRHCAAILAPHHSSREREVMAMNVAQRISGANISQLGFRFHQLATLFYPSSPERARAFLAQMEEAFRRGELVTKIPPGQKGLFLDDLVVWSDCPPVPMESPLKYWFPVAAHERANKEQVVETAPAADEAKIPGRLPVPPLVGLS